MYSPKTNIGEVIKVGHAVWVHRNFQKNFKAQCVRVNKDNSFQLRIDGFKKIVTFTKQGMLKRTAKPFAEKGKDIVSVTFYRAD